MSDAPFNEPKLVLNRIYTRGGDRGFTSLVGGQRVPKESLRIDCYGTVDELNSCVGMACVSASGHDATRPLVAILVRVQHELFNLGSILATLPEDVNPKQPRITAVEVEQLEREIDEYNGKLPPLSSFVLPGGSRLNAELHLCRTVCRRAERLTTQLSREQTVQAESIAYLNRLSDALFVWSRWVNVAMNLEEVLWKPNESASGKA